MKVKSLNWGCNADKLEEYELNFTAEEIETLKQCSAEYTKAQENEMECQEKRHKIVNKARYKRFTELFEKYHGKAVYSKNNNMYGRIMGINMDHYGRITSFCVSGFNVAFKVVNNRPYWAGDKPLNTMNIDVNDVEFISDDIYQHEAEKFVDKIKQDVSEALMTMDSWLPEAWTNFDRQLESNYINVKDLDDDFLYSDLEGCCEESTCCKKAHRY